MSQISEKSNLIYRHMTADDRNHYFELIKQAYLEEFGTVALNAEETRAFSNIPGFSLADDSYVAVKDGVFQGYINVWTPGNTPVRPWLDFYVAPGARGTGITEKLLQWGLKRAEHVYQRLPDNARVVATVKNTVADFVPILEKSGFESNRQSLRMRIDFDGKLPQANFSDGFHVVSMAEHRHLIDFVKVYRTAFQDLRGFTNDSLENRLARWQRDLEVHREYFNPEYFLLLREGNTDAGVLMAWKSSRFDDDLGWVSVLGILSGYRRRGLASNLLYHFFNLMYRDGQKGVGLSVDGSSLTGANRLYEKVGMRPFVVIHNYELELRSGIELSNQGDNS